MERKRLATIVGIGVVGLLVLGGIVGSLVPSGSDGVASTAEPAGSPGAALDSPARAIESPRSDAAEADGRSATGAVPEDTGGVAPSLGDSGTFAADVVRTGSVDLRIEPDRWEGVVNEVREALPEGAYVERSETGTDLATLVLRIPVGDYDATMRKVSALGREVGSSTNADDKSGEVVDLAARRTILTQQKESLEELIAQSTSLVEIQNFRNQAFAVQEEIERIAGRERLLRDQIDLATLTVSLRPEGAPVVAEGEATDSILAASWDRALTAAQVVVGGTLVVLGILVPLALIAAPVVVGVVVLRRRRHPALT